MNAIRVMQLVGGNLLAGYSEVVESPELSAGEAAEFAEQVCELRRNLFEIEERFRATAADDRT